MIKKIKKFFKNSEIKNERGNVMIVALAVITVMTFSLTTITQATINLAGATTMEINQSGDEIIAKYSIDIAISEFQTFLDGYDTLLLALESSEISYLDETLSNGVEVTQLEETIEVSTASAGYKFAYTLLNGSVLYKECYVSSEGQTTSNLTPANFSLGTEGTMVLNGGYYDEINIYGNDVLLSKVAPYIRNGTTDQYVTDWSGSEDPTVSNSTIFKANDYLYYGFDSYDNETNPTLNPFVLDLDNFEDAITGTPPADDPGEVGTTVIDNLFGNFSFEAYAEEFINTIGPSRNRTISSGDWITVPVDDGLNEQLVDLQEALDDLPEKYYTEINGFSNISLRGSIGSAIHQGELFITNQSVDLKNRTLIVTGNLTIDTNGLAMDKGGTIVVIGNLYIYGDYIQLKKTLSFIVFGETHINFNENKGFITGWNKGLDIIAKDNIFVESINEVHERAANPNIITAVFYTEESIYIDAVNSRFHIRGALLAKAKGVSKSSTNPDFRYNYQVNIGEGTTSTIANGIFINSYRGYISDYDATVPFSPIPDYESRDNGFYIEAIAANQIGSWFKIFHEFELIVTGGKPVLVTSEFILE